jgi:phosphopantothenoylcysteine synthetase/decarboxylase
MNLPRNAERLRIFIGEDDRHKGRPLFEILVEEARRKLESKNCDMVVGNLVGREGTGFESDRNEVVLVLATGETVPLPAAPKREIADRIFDHALRLRLALHATR